RSSSRSKLIMIAAGINFVLILAPVLFFGIFARGGDRTVQFTVGSSEAMAAWSAWVLVWPFMMFALALSLLASVIVSAAFLISHWRWNKLKRAKLSLVYVVLTVAHCLFAADWIVNNFPDA